MGFLLVRLCRLEFVRLRESVFDMFDTSTISELDVWSISSMSSLTSVMSFFSVCKLFESRSESLFSFGSSVSTSAFLFALFNLILVLDASDWRLDGLRVSAFACWILFNNVAYSLSGKQNSVSSFGNGTTSVSFFNSNSICRNQIGCRSDDWIV